MTARILPGSWRMLSWYFHQNESMGVSGCKWSLAHLIGSFNIECGLGVCLGH